MIKSDVLRRIESLLEEFSNSQRLIAQYILDHPAEVTSMTVTELAQAAESSPTSVMRLCQTIQVKSFSLLKVEIASALSDDKQVELEIKPHEPIETIKTKLLESSYQAMRDTLHYLTEDILHSANELIEKATVVYVFGSGASHLVADNIAQKWNRVGKIMICESNTHVLTTRLTSTSVPAVLIVVSNSGHTKETLLMQKMAKQNGIPTISITQFGSNPLSTQADVAIQTVKANESALRSAATSSLHVQFLTVDIMFFYYMSNRYTEILDYLKTSREQIQELNE